MVIELLTIEGEAGLLAHVGLIQYVYIGQFSTRQTLHTFFALDS
jgi:hypothetical protein